MPCRLKLYSFQDTIWNTWGPIDHTAVVMYGWSDKLVALLANYGSILYIVAFMPMVWILGYSVRVAMIVTSGFMAFGSLLRYLVLKMTIMLMAKMATTSYQLYRLSIIFTYYQEVSLKQ